MVGAVRFELIRPLLTECPKTQDTLDTIGLAAFCPLYTRGNKMNGIDVSVLGSVRTESPGWPWQSLGRQPPLSLEPQLASLGRLSRVRKLAGHFVKHVLHFRATPLELPPLRLTGTRVCESTPTSLCSIPRRYRSQRGKGVCRGSPGFGRSPLDLFAPKENRSASNRVPLRTSAAICCTS